MAKPLDLTGQRFGSLTVVSRAENNSRGNTQWHCQCDCGGSKIVLGYDLTHGRTTTCGCKAYLKDKPSPKRVDIVGKKFGKLTVISLNEERSKNGVLYWNCLCDCGNTFVASGSNLKNGNASHCGCSKKETLAKYDDLTGKRYGRLTVSELAYHENGIVYWKCICDCGNQKIVRASDLRNGHTSSCGCLLKESRRRNALTRSLENRDLPTDAETYRNLQKIFYGMHRRCSDKYCKPEHYHDRGISVCEEWKEFDCFLSWALANGYKIGLTIDRIDNNRGYSPDNCRWATSKEQQNNKRDNVYITIDGVTKTMKQWSEYYGLNYGMVRGRRQRGWPQSRWFEPKHSK